MSSIRFRRMMSKFKVTLGLFMGITRQHIHNKKWDGLHVIRHHRTQMNKL